MASVIQKNILQSSTTRAVLAGASVSVAMVQLVMSWLTSMGWNFWGEANTELMQSFVTVILVPLLSRLWASFVTGKGVGITALLPFLLVSAMLMQGCAGMMSKTTTTDLQGNITVVEQLDPAAMQLTLQITNMSIDLLKYAIEQDKTMSPKEQAELAAKLEREKQYAQLLQTGLDWLAANPGKSMPAGLRAQLKSQVDAKVSAPGVVNEVIEVSPQ